MRDDNDMPLANTYPLFVMRDGRGAAGIAYVGTACHSAKYLRTNVNEYYGDVATAEVQKLLMKMIKCYWSLTNNQMGYLDADSGARDRPQLEHET